ncbi:hypothetical protein ACFL48_03150 [Pseudomonadota bacterium]
MNRDKRSEIEEKIIGTIIIVMIVVGIIISFAGIDSEAADPQMQPVTSPSLK